MSKEIMVECLRDAIELLITEKEKKQGATDGRWISAALIAVALYHERMKEA